VQLFLSMERLCTQCLEFTVAVLEIYEVHLWP
jgi:hypothetical protein